MKHKQKPAASPAEDRSKSGMQIHSVPDVAALVSLRKKFDEMPKGPMTPKEIELRTLIAKPDEQIPETLSEEEKALTLAERDARRLMEDDDRARQALAAMIAFRRSYVVAYRELQAAVAESGEVHPMTEDFLVQAGAHMAARPFSEHDLMQGYVTTVLPWIADVVDAHAAEDARASAELAAAEAEARKGRRVPLGFNASLDAEDSDALAVGQSMVFVGWSAAVNFVLDRVTGHILKPAADDKGEASDSFCVARLYSSAPKGKDLQRTLIRLSPDIWAGCGNTTKSMPKMMSLYVAERLSQPVDALVCDDMSKAYTAGFIGRPAGANAGDALKALSRWCKAADAVLIGGLPLDDDDPVDVMLPEFEQLRTFSQLRAVHASDLGDGTFEVKVSGSLHTWKVDAAELKSFEKKNIILPS